MRDIEASFIADLESVGFLKAQSESTVTFSRRNTAIQWSASQCDSVVSMLFDNQLQYSSSDSQEAVSQLGLNPKHLVHVNDFHPIPITPTHSGSAVESDFCCTEPRRRSRARTGRIHSVDKIGQLTHRSDMTSPWVPTTAARNAAKPSGGMIYGSSRKG